MDPSRLRRAVRLGGVGLFVVAVFAGAVLLLPVWLGLPGESHWHRLMLFRSWI